MQSARYHVDPILPVILVFIGSAVTNLTIGLLVFPVFVKICVSDLLFSIARFGYFGVSIVVIGLLLEAYNLYEHHRRHVIALIIATVIISLALIWLIHLIAKAYSC